MVCFQAALSLIVAFFAAAPRPGDATALRTVTARRTSSVAAAASVSGSGRPSFQTLKSCEASYDRLLEQCFPHDGGLHTDSRGSARGEGLLDDEDGGSVVRHRSEKSQYGRDHYEAPASEAGPDGWDYRSMGDDWSSLGECGGTDQSPIDLARYVDVQGQTKYLLWFDYYKDPELNASVVGHLVNDGHGVYFKNDASGVDLGFVKIGEEEYVASEYVFHAPSEHSMDGAVFPLELQIYNQGKDHKGFVAVAILFREGASNPFLAALMAGTRGLGPRWTPWSGKTTSEFAGNYTEAFDLENLIPKGNPEKEHPFYNYQGSLTQPPCTTGVDWWVLSVPITASRDEIRFVRRAIFSSPSMRHGNARSTMPIGARSIFVGLTGFQHAVKEHGPQAWQHLDEVKEPRGYNSGDVPWGPHGVSEVPGEA